MILLVIIIIIITIIIIIIILISGDLHLGRGVVVAAILIDTSRLTKFRKMQA